MRVDRSHLALLALCSLFALAHDAGASTATCCNVAASYTADLFPGGRGDEDFFTVPNGPPSVMVLLDSSGSMNDFPKALDYSSLANGQGSCAISTYDDAAAASVTAAAHATYEQAFSVTNGNSNSPSWVTTGVAGNGCLANKAGANDCLFRYDKYYRYAPNASSPNIVPDEHDWSDTTAIARDTSTTGACYNAGTLAAACATCLTTKGYYLWKTSTGVKRGAFSGGFLNVFPPKYIIARRVLKTILSIDPNNPSNSDYVRFGLAKYGSAGASMLKELEPTCDASIDTNSATRLASFVTAHQGVISQIDSIQFAGATPLAEALFNLGQYFSDGTGSTGTGSYWVSKFGSSWWSSSFYNAVSSSKSVCWSCQQSSILVITDGAPANDNVLPTGSCGTDHTDLFNSVANCSGDFRRWIGGTLGSQKIPIDCPIATCGADEWNPSQPNYLHLVAGFLHNNDLWPGYPATGTADTKQTVTTYTISFGMDSTSTGAALLQKTADLGGGTYTNTQNDVELENAVFSAVSDVVSKTTSFSVSNTNTLQSATAAQLFTARFKPLDATYWEGHLYRFTLFNALALGCDPSKDQAHQTTLDSSYGSCAGKNPNLDGQTSNGNAACTGFYIVDSDCDPVIEDPNTGVFKKGAFDATTHVLSAGTTDAVPFWDAGKALSSSTYRPPSIGASDPLPYRSADESAASKRKIYTLIDNNSAGGDGKFDAHDQLVEFSVANIDQLYPYLSVDQTWCASLYSRLGWTIPSGTWAVADLKKCAKQIIYYTRGFDVLDEDSDGCAGPDGLGTTNLQTPIACSSDAECSPSTAGACNAGKCTCASGAKGEERDQANGHWKLGDIFHSSPQVVDPPFNEFMCDIGRGQTQCVATIHSPATLTHETQTKIDKDSSNVDAYDQWRAGAVSSTNSTVVRERKRIVLAGGNDGMLHAFDAGDPDKSQTANLYGDYPYKYGSGAELWAFIPPDLLPKLKTALDSTQPSVGHQYYVDGDVMVRDVWVDGGADGTGTKDHVKQSNEFHTLAVLSERSGGTQFVALDVTDPTTPKFRWSWPPLCSLDQNLVGQSWSDFSPRPPPIGPVKLALGGTAKDDLGRTFEERWIVLLNGGYDAGAVRGRGVFMLDAWTGSKLWSFTDSNLSALYSGTTPSAMFPVAASPGLVDVGNADQATLDSDGYFDTATWGDLGGQLWVARFKEPGTLTNGLVTNWYAARAMEELRQSDDSILFFASLNGETQYRSEFYRMTANIWEPNSASLRSFLGSGNRERLLVPGDSCGPSNIIGCAQAGCQVFKLKMTTTIGSCSIDTFFQDNNNKSQHNFVSTPGSGCTDPLSCGSGVSVTLDLNLDKCTSSGNTKQGFSARLGCDSNGVCTDKLKLDKSKAASTKSWRAYTNHNRFYGVWAYDSIRSFHDAAGAKTFDQNRFTDIPFTGTCAGASSCTLVNTTYANVDANGAVTCSSGSTCKAAASDAGWFYEYGRKCPLAGGCNETEWFDEKTGSGATVIGQCVDWNTMRPMGQAVNSTPCTSGSGFANSYTYLADAISGVPDNTYCGFAKTSGTTTSYVRASSRISIAPPLDPTSVITVSESGSVRQTALQIEPGSTTQKDLWNRKDVSQPIYWLEVPRDLHQCRHVDANACR